MDACPHPSPGTLRRDTQLLVTINKQPQLQQSLPMMSPPIDESAFLDRNMEESEHLIESGGFRFDEQEWPTQPADGSGLAFPFTATHTGPQTTDVLSGVAATYSVVSPGLKALSPIFDRLSPVSDLLYSSESSPAVSAPSNGALFEYTPQNFPSPLLSTYVSPVSLQESTSSGYDSNQWINPGAGFSENDFGFGSFQSMPLPSPSAFADTEFPGSSEYGRAIHQLPRRPARIGDGNEGPPINKRAKMTSQTDAAPVPSPPRTAGRPLLAAGPIASPGNAENTGQQSKSKLRSASRTSKNVVHRPNETTVERKTRDAHNLVEKQYRNRLNSQFEALLDTLPGSVRSPAGNVDPNSSDMNVDLGEKRLSKGDVLELATRYIRMLERDCGRLEQERNDLNRDVERLRSMFVNQGSPTSDGPGGEGLG